VKEKMKTFSSSGRKNEHFPPAKEKMKQFSSVRRKIESIHLFQHVSFSPSYTRKFLHFVDDFFQK